MTGVPLTPQECDQERMNRGAGSGYPSASSHGKNCVGCTFGETIDPCERVQQRTVEHLPVSQETVEAVTALPFERVQQRTTEHIEQKVDFSFSGKVCGRVALGSTRTLAADQRAKFHKLLRTLSNSSTSCHKSNFRKGSVNRS